MEDGLMPAPKGNQFWKLRSSHGRNPIFADPDQLWDACCEYFEWVDANPLWEDKVTSFQGVNTHEPIAKMRAMTLEGLCIFLDIARSTWNEYEKREDFLAVVTRVEEIIRTQKFTGAAADLLNPNIIARDLGLADKQEHKGDMKINTESDPRQISRAILAILGKAKLDDAPPEE